jgi:cupin superfamily acireductone dioxygenase involved in methionine salvage
MKPYRKNQVRVAYGQYECLLEGGGLIINPPLIDHWTRKNIEEYIEFLKLLLKEKEKWEK